MEKDSTALGSLDPTCFWIRIPLAVTIHSTFILLFT
jgi:hypothetical protein